MTKWDIRTEHDSALSFDPKEPSLDRVEVLHVSYRPAGQRGRFASFYIQGGLPKGATVEGVVDRYNAERGPQKWRSL